MGDRNIEMIYPRTNVVDDRREFQAAIGRSFVVDEYPDRFVDFAHAVCLRAICNSALKAILKKPFLISSLLKSSRSTARRLDISGISACAGSTATPKAIAVNAGFMKDRRRERLFVLNLAVPMDVIRRQACSRIASHSFSLHMLHPNPQQDAYRRACDGEEAVERGSSDRSR